MSTILKALKKAQDDRELFVAPKVDVYALPERPRRKLWPWLLGGLLAASVVFVAAFFWLYPVSQPGPSIVERADPGVTVSPQVAEPAEQAPSSGEAATIETPALPAAQTALAAAQPSAEPESPEDISMPAEPLPETEAAAVQDIDGETTVTSEPPVAAALPSEPPVAAALPSEPASGTRMDSSLMIDEETEFAAEKIRTVQPASVGSETYSAPDISSLAVAPELMEPQELKEPTPDFPDVPTPRAKPLEILAALAPPKLAEAQDALPMDEPLPSLEQSVQVAALPEHAVPEPEADAVVEPPMEDELARYAAVPVLRQMPREFRRSVPDLDISVHVYDGDPHWRFVRINKQKFREGDQVATDLTLEAITPGGLVLVYQGSAFQLAKP